MYLFPSCVLELYFIWVFLHYSLVPLDLFSESSVLEVTLE